MNERKNLKKKYTEFYDWLLKYLDECDPIGLVVKANPGSEYEPEAPHIIVSANTAKSPDELTDAIHSIFVRYFDARLAGARNDYRSMAHTIYEKWHRWPSG